jgi:hypothetical protein
VLTVENWRRILREGLLRALTEEELQALRRGLADEDPALLQGMMTLPPPLECVNDWAVEGADLLTRWTADASLADRGCPNSAAAPSTRVKKGTCCRRSRSNRCHLPLSRNGCLPPANSGSAPSVAW